MFGKEALLGLLATAALAASSSAAEFMAGTDRHSGEPALSIYGELDEGFYEQLVLYVDVVDPKYVYIKSPGGLVEEALFANDVFSTLNIVIVDFCLSACAFAVAGSSNITFTEGAVLGFHDSYLTNISMDHTLTDIAKFSSITALMINEVLVGNGYQPWFMATIISETTQNDFLVVTSQEELERAKDEPETMVKMTSEDLRGRF